MKSAELPRPEVRELWRATHKSQVVTELARKYVLHLELEKQPVRVAQSEGRFVISGKIYYGGAFKYGRHDVACFVGDNNIFKQRANNLERTGFLRFGKRDDSLNSLLNAVSAEQFLEPIRHEFLSLQHLSPIREESQQTIQVGSPPQNDVGHRGEYALPHLMRMFAHPRLTAKARFVEEFASIVADVDKIKFTPTLGRLLTQVKARNRQTGAMCSLADFGFGVSQCLPIFVQGALQSPGQLMLVEQPEAQLHPTAQLELGSFFSELWKRYRVPTILETHSANILLRLRKLVSQGRLQASDVSVAYFHVDEIHPTRGNPIMAVVVKNLDINEDGGMEKGLPLEFFGADIQEALEFGEDSE